MLPENRDLEHLIGYGSDVETDFENHFFDLDKFLEEELELPAYLTEEPSVIQYDNQLPFEPLHTAEPSTIDPIEEPPVKKARYTPCAKLDLSDLSNFIPSDITFNHNSARSLAHAVKLLEYYITNYQNPEKHTIMCDKQMALYLGYKKQLPQNFLMQFKYQRQAIKQFEFLQTCLFKLSFDDLIAWFDQLNEQTKRIAPASRLETRITMEDDITKYKEILAQHGYTPNQISIILANFSRMKIDKLLSLQHYLYFSLQGINTLSSENIHDRLLDIAKQEDGIKRLRLLETYFAHKTFLTALDFLANNYFNISVLQNFHLRYDSNKKALLINFFYDKGCITKEITLTSLQQNSSLSELIETYQLNDDLAKDSVLRGISQWFAQDKTLSNLLQLQPQNIETLIRKNSFEHELLNALNVLTYTCQNTFYAYALRAPQAPNRRGETSSRRSKPPPYTLFHQMDTPESQNSFIHFRPGTGL